MRVSIVAPTANERTARQGRFFTTRGHAWQLYVQEQPSEQVLAETTITPAAFLDLEHIRDTALFLFHFIDRPYPLLETMRRLRHGLVVLDLCGATAPEKAPVHYADLCLVADAAQKCALNEVTGYVLERICVLPDRQDYEEALEMTIDQAMRGMPPRTVEMETEPATMTPAGSDLEAILLIRDPALDQAAILNRVRQAIQHRQAAGGYGPDVSMLGPEALRPIPPEDDAADQAYTSLLRFQTALDDLVAKSHLQEPEFHSSVPLMGPLIVAVRRFWNWMSAKWYVRGWMAQQAAFNAQVVDVVGELLQAQESNERRIHKLELQLERLLRDDEESGP